MRTLHNSLSYLGVVILEQQLMLLEHGHYMEVLRFQPPL